MDYHKKEIDELTKMGPWIFKRILYRGILPILAIAIVFNLIYWPIKVFLIQPARVVEKTLKAENIIYNYEWFKLQFQDFEAIRRKIDNAKEALKSFVESAGLRSDWTFEDKNEWSRLNSVILGLKNQKKDIVAEYNARSAMVTREIFKTSELPDRLPMD